MNFKKNINMKNISKLILAAFAMVVSFAACNKVDDLPFYTTGKAVQLSSSVSTIAATPADANNDVVTFSWTNPNYAQDSSLYKFVIEIDSTGRNFAKEAKKIVTGKFSASMTGEELNNILLGFGFVYNTAYVVDVRVTSSYGNNNDLYKSNTIALNVTPYKIPPKVGLPAGDKLWANGGALPWNWTGAPPVPESEFYRIDNETWGAVLNLSSDNQFLVLSQNGGTDPYDKKYAVPNNQLPTITSGGTFGFYPPGTGGDNFKSPVGGGWYKMIMSFQTGTFTIESFGNNAMPQELYILGDATTGGWNNSPPAPQKFTRLNNCEYELTIAFVPGKFYKFISSYGNWQPQFGGTSATGGTMGANYGGGSDPSAVPTPTLAGNYKITVNFLLNTYTVIKL
jgi:hypothetical protein